MGNLFAYGTLMCEEIMADVSGCRLPRVAATLKGYIRKAVSGECYPAITPDRRGVVNGVAYLNLPDSAWDLLDRFEGEMYQRRPVAVALNDGTPLAAETYVIRAAFLGRLGPCDWDYDAFVLTGKKGFLWE